MSFACLAFWSEIHNNQQCCKGAWLPLEVMTLALLVQCTLRTTRGLSHQSTVMLKQAEGKDLRLLVILSSSVTSCLASREKNTIFSLHLIWGVRICHWNDFMGEERGIKVNILLSKIIITILSPFLMTFYFLQLRLSCFLRNIELFLKDMMVSLRKGFFFFLVKSFQWDILISHLRCKDRARVAGKCLNAFSYKPEKNFFYILWKANNYFLWETDFWVS